MDVGLDVAVEARKFFIRSDLVFGAFAVAQDRLRLFLVAPKIGLGTAGFEGLQAFAVMRRVKDSSARVRYAASALQNDVRGLPES